MIGLAAVFIAVAAVAEPYAFGIVAKGEPIPAGNRLELFLGAAIGAITFSGSVIAFGKLSGQYKFRLFQGAPVQFAGQHQINLVLGMVMLGLGLVFMFTGSWPAFFAMLAIAFVMGVLIIIPIGGADMPVVVSMLNSYSGWAAAGIGFSLNNSMLIIAGSLVGSSGAILSYIMCKAMNRSFFNVILGGFGGEATTAAAGGQAQRNVKSGSADDAAFVLGNAETVVIVPGYGLAVARAQHAVKELAAKLTAKGINVKYAIHPVAGRMPGHMNVLLAEAEVPYDQVFEMEDINGEFGQADLARHQRRRHRELQAELAPLGPGRRQEQLLRNIRELQDAVSAIENCRKPVLAAIHGACVGGGIDITSACDMRYASADATFAVKEIDVAIVADLGTLQRLPRLIGEGPARELALTGRNFNAAEAE
jgi:NAD(P) transhydrogenase subunit beta